MIGARFAGKYDWATDSLAG